MRELSCFFAREFFWTFLQGRLGPARENLLQEHLKNCSDCKSLLERERLSRKILEELSQVQPSMDVVAFLQKEHRFWDDILEKFGLTNSVETIKWVSQLSCVAVALVLTVHFFPWLNLARSLQNMRPSTAGISSQTHVEEAPPPQKAEVQAPFIGPRLPTPEEIAAMKAAPKKAEKAQEPNETGGETGTGTASTTAGGALGEGLVWRGTLKVDELTDDIATQVTKIIVDLGGRKAGQVELGWERDQEFYYHFILPEENYDKLMNELNSEGLVQLTKERHPRVVKAGYMRIIMTLEQNEDETR